MKQKVTPGTIARTVILALALVNQCLSFAGISPIPVEDESITQLISLVFTVVSAVIAWWKNNSFTNAAIQADEALKDLKEK